MKRSVLVLPVICFLLAAEQADDKSGKAEVTKLKGTWSVTEMVAPNGEKAPDDVIKEAKMIITETTISFLKGDKKDRDVGFKVDPSKTPKELDLAVLEGPQKGKTIKAIYKLDGDTLQLCLSAPDTDRPKEFKPDLNTKIGLVSLKKDK